MGYEGTKNPYAMVPLPPAIIYTALTQGILLGGLAISRTCATYYMPGALGVPSFAALTGLYGGRTI